MEIKTEIKDVRISYYGLGEILNYLDNPENRFAKISRAEYHADADGRNYFSVDVDMPHNMRREDADRIISYLRMYETLKDNDGLLRAFATPIETLELSVRASNCLGAAKIKTVGEIAMSTESDLLKIRSFGRTSLREIKRKLAEMGLQLGMRREPANPNARENQ